MLLRHGSGRTFVAVPSYGQIPAPAMFGLFKLLELDCRIACLVGDCHVDDARNLLVSIFLDTDCDQLLFIDADTAVEDLSRFIGHDRPVVGAVIPKKNDDIEFAANPLPGPIWADPDGLIEVFDCGTGVLKIQRHVLEMLFTQSRKYRYDERECAEIFNRDVWKGDRQSGDLNFCRKWRELGGKIFVDPEIRVSHTGDKTWSGTYGSYLRQAHGLSLSYGIDRIRTGTFTRLDVLDLFEEWGNHYAASHEMLVSCVEVARQAKGPILEVGSGLTSLCMAATGAEVHALEHDPVWLEKTREAKDRLRLDTLHLHYAPLIDYPEGRWHSVPDLPWKSVDILVCDGPPRRLGNRYIVYDVMQSRGCRPRLVIQDDMDNPKAFEALKEQARSFDFETMGEVRAFAVGRPTKQRQVA